MKYKILILTLIIIAIPGCSTITYDGRLFEEVASMNNGAMPENYTVVGQFTYEMRAGFVAYDLVTVKDPAIQEEMQKSLKINSGDAVINIKIKEVTDIVDILIGSLVGTVTQALFKQPIDIFSTRAVKISGDVVKYKQTSVGQRASEGGQSNTIVGLQ